MNKKFLNTCFFLSLTLIFLPLTAHSADQRPTVLANTCAGCHGTDGKSVGAIPPLHGIKADYFIGAMKDFRSDKREATVMNRIAKGFTDKEIESMAKFFSELK